MSFTLCLVWVNLGRMENIGRKIEWKTVFSTVWQTRENREEGKPGRKFSLTGPQIFSSQIRRKCLKRKCSLGSFTIMPYGIKLKKKKKKKPESTTMMHKIDGALNQNTNSNQNFKTNQIRTKKKKRRSKTDPSEPRWEEDMEWCFLNALE